MRPRVLIVPAAGLGSRLQSPLPKLLVPVAGVPMIDRLLDLYAHHIDRAVIVCNPLSRGQVESHVEARPRVAVTEQAQPTGMLDAITIGVAAARAFEPRELWITWCDQVGVHPRTIENLALMCDRSPAAALIMPTVRKPDPYIHLERDQAGRIRRVLHRREGDTMPDQGESDMGVFALPAATAFHLLPEYARVVTAGAGTGERNFLPFIPWIATRAAVITFPSEEEEEAIGVNTPDELRTVEAYLRRRDRDSR